MGSGRARWLEFPNKDKWAGTALSATAVGDQRLSVDVEVATLTNANTASCFIIRGFSALSTCPDDMQDHFLGQTGSRVTSS